MKIANFCLNEFQFQKYTTWRQELESKFPSQMTAAGGRYRFEFTPSGIGTTVKVKDTVTKKKLDLTDYESW